MKDKKLQIFVSSTYTDLREERQAAVEAILSSGHIPAGMELFAAGDESQMTVIERWIDESDVYLLILAGRYGSVDKKTGKSYIQQEYEYALNKKKPLFAIVISEKALEDKVRSFGTAAIEQENPGKLKEFRTIVLNNLVKFGDDKKDIKIAIHETLSDISFRKDLTGWIRGDNSVNTGILAEEIARLTKENSELREKISGQGSVNAVYANLTYEELQKLLERDSVTVNKKQMNIFQFLLEVGQIIANKEVVEGEMKTAIEKLVLFNLIRVIGSSAFKARYEFTREGHSFYLKARLLNPNL